MTKFRQLQLDKSGKFFKIFLTHLTGVVVFIVFETSLALILKPSIGILENLLYYLLEIGTFYLNLLVIMPQADSRRTRVMFIVNLILLIAVFSFSRIALLKVLYPLMFEQISNAKQVDQMFARAAWRGVYIVGLSIVYWLFKRDKESAVKKKQLEIDRLAAIAEKRHIEISLLQMQLEPHLINNVLAFIYNKIETTEPEAAKAVEQLSELLNYSLTDIQSQNKVSITEEIESVKTLIAIHNSLSNALLAFELLINDTEGADNVTIPPKIMATFIDNIFTHGVVNNPDDPAKVEIEVTRTLFSFHSENKKGKTRYNGRNLGISNVRSILNYFYKEQYELKIEESDSRYVLDLKIAL